MSEAEVEVLVEKIRVYIGDLSAAEVAYIDGEIGKIIAAAKVRAENTTAPEGFVNALETIRSKIGAVEPDKSKDDGLLYLLYDLEKIARHALAAAPSPAPTAATGEPWKTWNENDRQTNKADYAHTPAKPPSPALNRDALFDETTLALQRLRNEVHACWGMCEPQFRREFGNTNYNCVVDALAQADVALSAHQSKREG